MRVSLLIYNFFLYVVLYSSHFQAFLEYLHFSNFLVNTSISNINKSFIEHSFLTACDITRCLFYFILFIFFQTLIATGKIDSAK